VPVIINSDIRDGSLRACAADLGSPVLIYEAGEALRFDEVCIRGGLRGILNVMRKIGMLPDNHRSKPLVPVEARSTSWVRAPSSGIVSRMVNLGATVACDDHLATIGDPLGENSDEVLAPFDGIVIGRSNLPLAHEGDALFHIAAFKSIAAAESRVEDFVASNDPNGQVG
jgi:predicted deacylase